MGNEKITFTFILIRRDLGKSFIFPRVQDVTLNFIPDAGPILDAKIRGNSFLCRNPRTKTVTASAAQGGPCMRSCTHWASTMSMPGLIGTSTSRSSRRMSGRENMETLTTNMTMNQQETITTIITLSCIMAHITSGDKNKNSNCLTVHI